MPGKVKLLNAAGPGVTGPWIKIGMGPPPITIRTSGGYTTGVGNGPTIQVSSGTDIVVGSTVDSTVEPAKPAMGVLGGQVLDATTANLVDLIDKSIASMPYYPATFIRAVTGAGLVGTATVWMEYPR